MERCICFICLYLFKSPVVPHLRLNMKPCEISYLIWQKEINAPSSYSKLIARAF